MSRDGEIGKHTGLKILWPQGLTGSIPVLGISYMKLLKDIFTFSIPRLFLFTLIIFLFILMIAFSLIGVYYVYDWLNWAGLIKSYPFSSGVVG